jgi:cell division protein ZapA
VGEVTVIIHGRDYHMGCQDGQEEHLIRLAGYVDGKIKDLVETVGNIGDMPLLAMAGILVADELADSRRDNESTGGASTALQESLTAERGSLIQILDAATLRVDGIAASLEPT